MIDLEKTRELLLRAERTGDPEMSDLVQAMALVSIAESLAELTIMANRLTDPDGWHLNVAVTGG